MEVDTLYNQTMVDMAMQGSGSIAVLFELALANGKSISDSLVPGEPIKLLTAVAGKADIAAALQAMDNRPASGDELTPLPDGVDYMQVGADFIIK